MHMMIWHANMANAVKENQRGRALSFGMEIAYTLLLHLYMPFLGSKASPHPA